MSRQANLPPRCPFQKKPNLHPIYNPSLNKDFPLNRHHKSVSHSYLEEEQPAWLDDLLENPEPNSGGIMHRRSASDSLTLLDDNHLVSLTTNLDHFNNTKSDTSGSIYGPNSPRGKGNITFQENSVVSALSEYVSHRQLQYVDESFCTSTGDDVMVDTQSMKRHPGQRSRIRKLQYIAELERTVDMLQQNESDMAARVASLLEQRRFLSMENSKLKQKLIRLQQRKLFVDGQNQVLKKEFEMLKVNVIYGGKKGILGITTDETKSWQMLDMGKLNLN